MNNEKIISLLGGTKNIIGVYSTDWRRKKIKFHLFQPAYVNFTKIALSGVKILLLPNLKEVLLSFDSYGNWKEMKDLTKEFGKGLRIKATPVVWYN